MKGIKQIKKYRLIREIGKGATGIVYEAVDDQTNKLCAVKAIASSKLQDKRVMENFKRELKLLHGLNHGNIIKIGGVEKTVNNIYLILEYCNGGNLYEYSYYYRRTYGGTLPEKKIQKILIQLIDGLEYMHNCRTVHRDIKLENILINFDSVSNTICPGGIPEKVEYSKVDLDNISIKIADLGYARELDGDVASTICGTPITMAPDIINLFDNSKCKDYKYNNKVDLWSLGAITYELITGRPPFYASNYKQLFEEVMEGKYNLPKNLKVSIEAITFINGLLQFYPEKRMSWSEIRAHPFIANDPNTFHTLDLHTIDTNFENPEQLQVNTKDCENFLWILFQNKIVNSPPLDKIDASIYQNPILNEISQPLEVLEVKDKNQENEEKVKKEDSEGDYEDANNEINLCDETEEKLEDKNLENQKIEANLKNFEEVSGSANNANNANNSNNVPSNNSIGNRLFDRIFTEMKQELKNSKQSINNNANNINLEVEKKNEIRVEEKKESDINKNNVEENKSNLKEELQKEEEEIKKESNSIEEEIKEEKTEIVEIEIKEEKIEEEIEIKKEQHEEIEIRIPEKIPEKIEEINPLTTENITPKFPTVHQEEIKNVKEEVRYSDLPRNPSENQFEQCKAIESNMCFDSLSRETGQENAKNFQLSEDFLQVTEQEEDKWEIISTTSITENEIHYDIDSDGFQLIPEYFK